MCQVEFETELPLERIREPLAATLFMSLESDLPGYFQEDLEKTGGKISALAKRQFAPLVQNMASCIVPNSMDGEDDEPRATLTVEVNGIELKGFTQSVKLTIRGVAHDYDVARMVLARVIGALRLVDANYVCRHLVSASRAAFENLDVSYHFEQLESDVPDVNLDLEELDPNTDTYELVVPGDPDAANKFIRYIDAADRDCMDEPELVPVILGHIADR